MTPINIRTVNESDLAQLQAISRQTFYETFSIHNSESSMKKYLDEAFDLDKLKAEINNPYSRFYFAILQDTIAGYLKVNLGESQTELKDNHALEIERIYVLEAYHGAKIGQMLYHKAVEFAKESSLKYLWLGVWEKNLRALRFYQKNGFVEFDKHIFKLGDDEQCDLLLRLDL
jgi:ribosomal protein S18 acetylase RimI-like enzyme